MRLNKIVFPDKTEYILPEEINIDSDKYFKYPPTARVFYVLCELMKFEKVEPKINGEK